MGRPKGSKNKPKLPKPETVVTTKVEEVPKPPEQPVSIEKQEETKEPGEDEEPSLEDALKSLASESPQKKPHKNIKQKKMEEQIAFIFEELKSLRAYVGRIEDARLNIPLFESVIPKEITKKHFKENKDA